MRKPLGTAGNDLLRALPMEEGGSEQDEGAEGAVPGQAVT